MKFVFFLLIFIMIDKLTDARRRMFKKRDNYNCADAVSRIASDIAAKAANGVKNIHCGRCDITDDKICSAKLKLVDRAVEAAQITQSNLAGKLALVNQLTEEKEVAKTILHELIFSQKQLEEAIDKEIEALATATTLKDVLDRAIQLASEVAVSADIVFSALSNNIQLINKILDLENGRCQILCRKEQCAKTDVEATRLAEKQAVSAATNAKNSALEMKTHREGDYG